MSRLSLLSIMILSALLVSCTDSGTSSVPDIPIDPAGTVARVMVPGGNGVSVDDVGHLLYIDEDMQLHGDSRYFCSVGDCKGIGYILDIPRSGWNVSSLPLGKGKGVVSAAVTDEGTLFTALYVDDIDSLGCVNLKAYYPLYGRGVRFSLSHNMLELPREAVDTVVVLTAPTTYRVELASGEWIRFVPHVSFVQLFIDENNTGAERRDTLRFSNGIFAEKTLPIVQTALDGDAINSAACCAFTEKTLPLGD